MLKKLKPIINFCSKLNTASKHVKETALLSRMVFNVCVELEKQMFNEETTLAYFNTALENINKAVEMQHLTNAPMLKFYSDYVAETQAKLLEHSEKYDLPQLATLADKFNIFVSKPELSDMCGKTEAIATKMNDKSKETNEVVKDSDPIYTVFSKLLFVLSTDLKNELKVKESFLSCVGVVDACLNSETDFVIDTYHVSLFNRISEIATLDNLSKINLDIWSDIKPTFFELLQVLPKDKTHHVWSKSLAFKISELISTNSLEPRDIFAIESFCTEITEMREEKSFDLSKIVFEQLKWLQENYNVSEDIYDNFVCAFRSDQKRVKVNLDDLDENHNFFDGVLVSILARGLIARDNEYLESLTHQDIDGIDLSEDNVNNRMLLNLLNIGEGHLSSRGKTKKAFAPVLERLLTNSYKSSN